MSAVPKPRTVTAAEYLARERKAEIKSEFIEGEIRAMAGASSRHATIVVNLSGELRNALRDSSCTHYTSDLRVAVEATGLYTYPDVVVACGEPRFLDGRFDVLVNPVAIVEVLSPSTESYDRGKKFAHYRRVPSLRDYVLVSPSEMRVEVFSRREEVWSLTQDLSSPEDLLTIESAGASIPLREIYLRVKFDEAEEA